MKTFIAESLGEIFKIISGIIMLIIFAKIYNFFALLHKRIKEWPILQKQNESLKKELTDIKNKNTVKYQEDENEKTILVEVEFKKKYFIESKLVKCSSMLFDLTNKDFAKCKELKVIQTKGDLCYYNILSNKNSMCYNDFYAGFIKEYTYYEHQNENIELIHIYNYDEENQLKKTESIETKKIKEDSFEIKTTFKNNQLYSTHKTLLNSTGHKKERIEDEKNEDFKSGKTSFHYNINNQLAKESFFEINGKTSYNDKPSHRIKYYYYSSSNKLLKEVHKNLSIDKKIMPETVLYKYKNNEDNWELISEILRMPIYVSNCILTFIAILEKRKFDLKFHVYSKEYLKVDILKEQEEG